VIKFGGRHFDSGQLCKVCDIIARNCGHGRTLS
jgi:hypothetical protein